VVGGTGVAAVQGVIGGMGLAPGTGDGTDETDGAEAWRAGLQVADAFGLDA
jgi:hypothetical protein